MTTWLADGGQSLGSALKVCIRLLFSPPMAHGQSNGSIINSQMLCDSKHLTQKRVKSLLLSHMMCDDIAAREGKLNGFAKLHMKFCLERKVLTTRDLAVDSSEILAVILSPLKICFYMLH